MKKNIVIVGDDSTGALGKAIANLLDKEGIHTVNIIHAPASIEDVYPELSKYPELIVPITNPYKDLQISYKEPKQRPNRTPKKKKRK